MNDTSEKFDFTIMGAEIKAAREKRGWTQAMAAEYLDISESYLKAIENSGKPPGFQVFYRIMVLFAISVDKHFFPEWNQSDGENDKSLYLRASNLLRERETSELYVLISAMDGMEAVKKAEPEGVGAGEAGKA